MRFAQDVVVTAGGAVTSLLTALALFWLQETTGLALYSFMFWLVIPIGAIGSGWLAAMGYYFAAKWVGRRPTSLVLIGMLTVSVGTFFAVHYLEYRTIKIDGRPLAAFMPFPDYLDWAIRSTSYSVKGKDTGKLGVWGYGVAALQVVGFASGGLIVYGMLTSLPYCEKCVEYLGKKQTQTRYFAAEAEADRVEALGNAVAGADPGAALLAFSELGTPVRPAAFDCSSEANVWKCPKCDLHHIAVTTRSHAGETPVEVPALSCTLYFHAESVPTL